MWLPDQSLCIVYNGEIHNYRDLRGQLIERGYRRSETDTEVVLHASGMGRRPWTA
jgi:asparagine synthase (glutamine-hydrolysing)